ncbi:restriction endonuclease subunit S [uncultured Cellulomonas sp.]|uniref:restriction endonuclease subunit S n=1 Tax=uncultured Cellulomonas sp. TaxID=189682 RepID=UPI002615770F|nr:restriction endonuclease subunit S [uncultured Cellulomonas sp.]
MTTLPEAWREKIPSYWEWTRLKYVAAVGTGHTPDRAKPEYWVDCTIPWVTAADLSRRPSAFEPLQDTQQHVSELGVANSAAVVHPQGTVMFCRTASVGLFGIIGVPMATTQAFVTWTAGRLLESRYLLYLIAAMKSEFERLAHGSTHLTIYMPDLEGLDVPLPPLDEQRRIADFLDDQVSRIDSVTAARNKQVELLQEAARAELAERLLSSTRDEVPIKRLISDERLGIWGHEPGEAAIDVRVARVADFDRTAFGLRAVDTIRSVDAAQLRSRMLARGDVLLERSGGTQRNPVGCPAFVEDVDGPTVSSNFVSRLRPAVDVGDGRYIALVLGAMYWTRRQAPFSTQTTGIQNLDSAAYLATRVPDRTLAEQVALAGEASRTIEDLRMRCAALRLSSRHLSEYKQSLITAAVSGELDVTTASTRSIPA